MTHWLCWQATDDPSVVLADSFETESAAEAHAAELVRRGVRTVTITEGEMP